ncbi:unnamed protein product [Cylindrotheca closterium]|uniref:Uncharacterized protein n=1 Tax=Cylindrotheca closterium TaxID=2856 RepID=A0AAD2PXI2_9STRA|nr:unnamed protein product [Cylindrotheca closterium]
MAAASESQCGMVNVTTLIVLHINGLALSGPIGTTGGCGRSTLLEHSLSLMGPSAYCVILWAHGLILSTTGTGYGLLPKDCSTARATVGNTAVPVAPPHGAFNGTILVLCNCLGANDYITRLPTTA